MHLKPVEKQAICTSVTPWSPSVFADWVNWVGTYPSVWCETLARNTCMSVLWPNKLGDLSEPEDIKVHIQRPPDGHCCQGVSQTSCQICPVIHRYWKNKQEPEHEAERTDHWVKNVLVPFYISLQTPSSSGFGIWCGITYITFWIWFF